MMEKVVRNGKVAVLVSPGFGAGWYTWNREHPECLYDADMVAWVEGGKEGPMPDLEDKYGSGFYNGGGRDLIIYWIDQGEQFRVDEYDGSESLVFGSEEKWITA